MTKEALKLALEALEAWVPTIPVLIEKKKSAITAIKEALAQPQQDGECKYCTDGCPACDARKLPEQEPVVFNTLASLKHKKTVGPIERAMLNTTPPQRTWVGLTDEEVESLQRLAIDPIDANGWGFLNRERFARLIEIKLKEKNT
jgi:hypothetical protein